MRTVCSAVDADLPGADAITCPFGVYAAHSRHALPVPPGRVRRSVVCRWVVAGDEKSISQAWE
ncbi:hypothetical protein GCM10010297_13870 [Streptomyces malachitofuscus]|nr:hypothetical protein GCM10010297_13870 [Streptomyces malachitofuscus]